VWEIDRVPPNAADWAFFLDVDGTLLEHAEHPHGVRVGAEHRHLLQGLQRATSGAVALISGRSVADLDQLFAPLDFAAAGQHGIERRSIDGAVHRHTASLEHLGHAAAQIVQLTAAHAALVFENKGLTLALHYRQAPELRELVASEMQRIAVELGDEFELQAGKFIYEIKPSGKDKGTAIAEFMQETPFAGRVPVFAGDDLTDEYGFAHVEASGGHSIKVGPGETHARWRLAHDFAVRRWLAEYVGWSDMRRGAKSGGGDDQP